MAPPAPEPYRVDPDDPRAPSLEVWESLSTEERARVVAALPNTVPFELCPPEGDVHRRVRSRAIDALDGFFRRTGRKMYVSSEINVHYPGEPRFAPDVLVVGDVDPHDRTKWIVADEGKGLDLVIEVLYGGDPHKDLVRNVEWFPRLGIEEYFVLDAKAGMLRGFRLPEDSASRPPRGRTYRRIIPQQGRFASQVLGLDLAVEQGDLRFLYGLAPLPYADELIAKLGQTVDDVLARKQEAEARAEEEKARAEEEKARADAEKARTEEERARADAEKARADALAAQLAELLRSR